MLLALAFVLSLVGWAALALAMHRHSRQIWQRDIRPIGRTTLRVFGCGCLGLALVACAAAFGGSIGPVAWAGVISIAALILVFLLPLARRLAK